MISVRLTTLGRHGNQMFRAAKALAICEQNGFELRMEESPLEKIFTLDGYVPKRPDGTEDIVIEGYCQSQADLIYSRADCRRWFKLRPDVAAEFAHIQPQMPHVHLRRGDYAGAGYPVISRLAAERAVVKHAPDEAYVEISDDGPDPESRWLSDFVRLMRAPVLFRANSSFSYWAAVLSHARVFSPVITGLAGGVEHDNVPFIEGNSARLAELPFVTELHLRET